MKGATPKILVVSSDQESRQKLTSILQRAGWSAIHASRISEGRQLLTNEKVSMVFCDRRVADGSYRDLLNPAHPHTRNVPVVVTSRLADWDEYQEALRHGAVDLIASPCKLTDVSSAISQAEQHDPKTPEHLAPLPGRR
jgi:DNA-binding NtrC family response regulator